MRRNALTALALALVLATAGCSAVATSDASSAADAGGSTIQVAADGSAETAPDQAVVRLSVVSTGDDPAAVRDRLAANVSAVRSALDDVGVASVRTVRYDVGRNHEKRKRERGAVPGYRGEHTLEVTVDNVSEVGDVIDAAVESGDATVDGVRFTLAEETRRELRQAALTEAMGDARTQAETLATEAGLEITGVGRVTTTPRDYRPVTLESRPAADGADTAVATGPVSVDVSVRVTYNASAA